MKMTDGMKEMRNDMIKVLRKTCPDVISQTILSVQPMSPTLYKDILDNASRLSEEELLEVGYKPVSSHKLLWIKNEKSN